MGPRIVTLAALLARRQGPAVAEALLRTGRAWLADPANEGTKQALLTQLRCDACVERNIFSEQIPLELVVRGTTGQVPGGRRKGTVSRRRAIA